MTPDARTSHTRCGKLPYTAGLVAVLLGAVLVFFLFPKKREEQQLLAAYQDEDAAYD